MEGRTAWIALSVLTGLLMVALGIVFLARPDLSLASVLLLFGAATIAYGVILTLAGLIGRTESRGWAMGVGLLAVLFGVVVLVWPESTALTLLYVIAAWMIISGIAEAASAFRGRVTGGQRAWRLVTGLLAIGVGILFFARPAGGALALLWLIGIYLIALGLLRIAQAFTGAPPAQAA